MNALAPLYQWYNQYKRELPWRQTNDPYLIWLSEVILQQTRVEQGLPYYLKFSAAFKNIEQLARAPEEKVMKMWQGLGYYSRATNMMQTAKLVVEMHQGKFPSDYASLIQLKGIGPYTAAAISSFASNEAHAVVDGNVYRVLSRLFNIKEPINSHNGKKLFARIANEVLNKKNPATHNQAMMELGALICKPQKPDCENCPLRLQCISYQEGNHLQLPIKNPKKKPVMRYLNFIVADAVNFTILQKRSGKGIWHNLYEPPSIESTSIIDNKILMAEINKLALFKTKKPIRLKKVYECKHQLTHQTIYAVFWVVACKASSLQTKPPYVKAGWKDISKFAVHRLFDKFLKYYNLQQQLT